MSGATAFPAAAIVSGILVPARLGSGTPSADNFLRGDGSWQVVPTPTKESLGLGNVENAAASSLYLPLAGGTLTGPVTGVQNIIEQRNGVKAQTLRIYNTFVDTNNYERAIFSWISNELYIGTQASGSGSNRKVNLTSNNNHLNLVSSDRVNVVVAGFPHVTFLGNVTEFRSTLHFPGANGVGTALYPAGNLHIKPSASQSPSVNGGMCFEATNNTTVTIKLRGTDGVLRAGTITMA